VVLQPGTQALNNSTAFILKYVEAHALCLPLVYSILS